MLRPYIVLLHGMKNQCIFKIETGFAFKPHMKKLYVDAFKNKGGNDSVKLKTIYPPDLKYQHLPVKEKSKENRS